MPTSRASRNFALAATVVIVAVAAALYYSHAAPTPNLFGFSTTSSAAENGWEQKFRAIPEPDRVKANMQYMAASPHNVGSPRQHEVAEWVLQQFKSYGLDAHIEKFETLYPTPLERQVELVSPGHYEAVLKEPAIPEDPTSGQAGQLPTMVMYAPDGDVTAPLVYVNYGIPEDYAVLDKLGISVKGKIVIARYGNSWRGIKPKLAALHGAVGCLIYSDPRDDGYFQGDVYPKGPYRPEQGVQRGSVMMMEVHPGDPETPGWGSVPGAKRLPLDKVDVLEKIPTQPISYGDALPLLKALDGPVAPVAWRGALPITYHIGPGSAVVHLKVKYNWGLAPLYDVIATIPGSQFPDQWVVRGNHLDAWVNGAEDPISGQSALLEEARAYGLLLKQGWRPKRTIVYAAWDGEEPALLGSTEWAETHADELQKKAVAYFNSDTNGRGYLGLEGSQTLQHFLNLVAQDITDPETGQTVWLRDQQHREEQARTPQQKAEIMDGADMRIGALGSGSDFSPFLQHLGIASTNLGYGGEGGGGVYHSIYDDFYWYSHFADTKFVYGRALAQTMGTAIMRMADADVLPLQFTGFADNVLDYQKSVEAEYKAQAGAPKFDFAPLEKAVADLHAASADYDQAMQSAAANGSLYQQPAADLLALNQLLYTSERKLMNDQGLPQRPWFKHEIYAPGFFTGYGVKTLPGLREAIEDKNYSLAQQQQPILVAALEAFTAQVKAARAKL